MLTETLLPCGMDNQHVAILMATFNGENYLSEQLQSLLTQTHAEWSLWVSDDGSTDRTLAHLGEFGLIHGRLKAVREGPRFGFARNFLSLLACEEIRADYYAFCDQDDVWHSDKLKRAVDWFSTQPPGVPAFYCSRSVLIDIQGHKIGESPLYKHSPSFANALVQCFVTGNTVVLNRAARNIVCTEGWNLDVQSHEWWAYIIVSGAGGRIYYDPLPSLDYRQHGHNLVGSNRGFRAQLLRLRKLLNGDFRDWNRRHLLALNRFEHMLTEVNRTILQEFHHIHHGRLLERLLAFYRARLYRQTFIGNIGLLAAALFKQI